MYTPNMIVYLWSRLKSFKQTNSRKPWTIQIHADTKLKKELRVLYTPIRTEITHFSLLLYILATCLDALYIRIFTIVVHHASTLDN